jgi:hypothetical protein
MLDRATRLLRAGECWFKDKQVEAWFWDQFLCTTGKNLDWKKRVPRLWIVEKWKRNLLVLQKVITCEGQYSITFLYYIHLLLHFEYGNEFNFPFYLSQILGRMAKHV